MSTGEYLLVWLRTVECSALVPEYFLRWRVAVIVAHIVQQTLAKGLSVVDFLLECDLHALMAIRNAWKDQFEDVGTDLEHCAVDAC